MGNFAGRGNADYGFWGDVLGELLKIVYCFVAGVIPSSPYV